MDISPDKIWLPKEWESHANDLLRERYTSAKYIPIPDHDKGDGGIEGFSLDGHAYQMYCPEGAVQLSTLYEKQRDKMTKDIGKFIENKAKMKGFFGSLKIKRWILVVPEHKTKDMVTHATKKTEEIKSENLEYVDNSDFRVLIWDRNEFRKEEVQLLASGIAILKLDEINVLDQDVECYQEKAPEFVSNMTRKLNKINNDPNAVKKGQDKLLKKAIISQNMLSELKQDYAEFYEQITSVTMKRADQLDIEALDAEPETQKLGYQIKTLQAQLQEKCNLHYENLDTISHGAIADWLMNCTLDFN